MAETTLPIPLPYEPPRVERVLGPEDLEREILYAGADTVPSGRPV
jgi:hypothetical protein